MKLFTRTAAVTVLMALSASPALAVGPPAGTPTADDNPGTAYRPATTPTADSNPGTAYRPATTPTAENNPGTARRLAAPGQYCKAASKQRLEGQKGTPFSACVKAQARLRSGATNSPRTACKDASKKHVKGTPGTPFSTCVKAAAKLLKDKKAQDEAKADEAQPAETPTAAAPQS